MSGGGVTVDHTIFESVFKVLSDLLREDRKNSKRGIFNGCIIENIA